MARRKKEEKLIDRFVMWKSVLIAGILLGVFFSLAHLFLPRLIAADHSWHNRVLLGLKVVLLWLVVSSTLRALNQLREKMPAWQLALGGIFTALGGCLVKEAIMNVVLVIRGEEYLADFDYQGVLFFTGIGLILSLVTMINLRVRNRALGNVLEFLVIAAFLALLFYLL